MLSLVRCCAVQSKLLHSKTTPYIVLQSARQAVRCFATDRRTKNRKGPVRERKNSVREKDREDSRRSPGSFNEGEEKSNVAGMKDLLDKIDAGTEVPLKGAAKGKLGRSLVKAQRSQLSPIEQGSIDAHSEDIADVLNDALYSSKFMFLFRGIAKTSDFLEIHYCKANQDVSHVTAFWRSDVVEDLINAIIEKDFDDRSVRQAKVDYALEHNLVFNKDDAEETAEERKMQEEKDKKKVDPTKVLNDMEKFVNKKLQEKEGLFRTYLSKNLEFRRIPRIFFEISDGKGMKQEIARNENRYVSPEHSGKRDGDLRKDFMDQMALNKNADVI